ncbi:DUF1080 domain-containing protein [soil metagenome]
MKKNLCWLVTGISSMFIIASCNNAAEENTPEPTAVEVPAASEWISLFDGKTLAGWHGFNKTGTIPNWEIEDSAMVCLGASADAHGGDIVSDSAFDNFELKWDWKISKGGNSGVMYHVVENPKYKSPYETGPEYQVIDDIGFPEKLEEWQKTGADYAMNLTNDKKKLMPVGEWNSSRIVFNKGHVEHWLNGEKIVEFEAWDDKWNKEKAEGKWKDYPDYGNAKTGLIALQDHGNKAFFKNIRIKKL